MDKEEAAATLGLLRKVVAQARDDTALQNFGLIWMCSSVTNGAGFLGTHYLLSHGHTHPGPYVLLWAAVFVCNGLFIATLKGKSAKVPSFIERQIWSIWNTFIAGMVLTAVVNYLFGLSVLLFMPAVASILAAMAFSVMGAIMGRGWYVPAGLWAAISLVHPLIPSGQFALFGVFWALTQGLGGALLHREKLRRTAEGSGS